MYRCECGKEFINCQSFNGHKCHCKEHQLYKYKSLDKFNSTKEQRIQSYKNTIQNRKTEKKLLRQEQSNNELNQWISEQHKCEKCGKIMTEKFGSGRFCSRACANSRARSDETKLKISNRLKGRKTAPEYRCKQCNKIIRGKRKYGLCKHCYTLTDYGKECRHKAAALGTETKRNNNSFSGWQSRNIISYPEQFWIKVLNNNMISFTKEYIVSVDKRHRYFLDFFIEENGIKIDLEIDGKQHEYDYNIEHDKERDYFLTHNNYIVYRIKWNEINSDEGKIMMQNKINDFLSFINNIKLRRL